MDCPMDLGAAAVPVSEKPYLGSSVDKRPKGTEEIPSLLLRKPGGYHGAPEAAGHGKRTFGSL